MEDQDETLTKSELNQEEEISAIIDGSKLTVQKKGDKGKNPVFERFFLTLQG